MFKKSTKPADLPAAILADLKVSYFCEFSRATR